MNWKSGAVASILWAADPWESARFIQRGLQIYIMEWRNNGYWIRNGFCYMCFLSYQSLQVYHVGVRAKFCYFLEGGLTLEEAGKRWF